jgi:DNA-binding CsgD family transcriptional regulator
MPSDPLTEVADASRKIAEWTARREAAVHRAREAGHSLREIADAAGVTHQTIANLLNR